uniref:N-acyl homoserine lactonase family protein n=1 Tax=Roseivirga sp. TaxID=1964215 RepID=UPI004047F7CD
MNKINFKPILALATALIISSCGGAKTSNTETAQVEKTDIQVYAFNVGDILVKDISLFNPGVDVGQPMQFSNTAYLIRHPKGDLIWDTGLPDGLNQMAEGNDSEAFLMKMPVTLASQMEAIGVAPSEVEFLAVSHLHGDHIGNVNMFANATVILQKEEYDALFNGETPVAEVADLKSNPSVQLTGDHDVFGDGSVVIKRATGHTPGHQVLFLDLAETGPVVLSGDLYHFAKNRELRGVPAFNTSKDASLASMDAIEAFIKEKNATLWIQHDYKQQQTIPHAPEVIK